MSKKTRYLLLVIGFIIFLILTPLIVLYVRGISYNFKTQSFVKTGIIAINAEPKSVSIFLDGQLKRKNSGDIRFVLPGEYNITIEKPNYNTWHKHMAVLAGQVTWATPSNGAINLLLKESSVQTISQGVVDFFSRGNQLIYLTKDSVVVANDINDPGRVFALPRAATKISQDDGNANFLLSSPETKNLPPVILVFNASTGQFTDLSPLFKNLPDLGFAGNGTLLALDNTTLYKIDLADKIKTPILTLVKAFYVQAGVLYFVREVNGQNSLLVSPSPFSQNQLLLTNLPAFSQAQLKVTFEKQIFLLAEGNLYLAGQQMQKLADNVSFWDLINKDSIVSVLHSGQLDYYDAPAGNLNFVTRSSDMLKNPLVNRGQGYAFFLKNNQLNAIELDTRDNQNQYVLFQSQNLLKFFVDNSAQNILLLDGDSLKNLVIR